jgi:hypothetical protein
MDLFQMKSNQMYLKSKIENPIIQNEFWFSATVNSIESKCIYIELINVKI